MSDLKHVVSTWGESPEGYAPEEFDPAKALGDLLEDVEPVKEGVLVGMSQTFKPIADFLSNRLRRLTVSNLKVDETLDPPATYAEEWDHWLSILHAWAEQVCFLPGADCDFAMGLSTDPMAQEHIGVVVELVLSNLPHDKVARDAHRTWRWQKGYVGEKYDAAVHKSCMCLWYQVPPEAVDWDELRRLIDDDLHCRRIVQPVHPLEHLLYYVGIHCHLRSCPYAILSDGEVSFFMDVETTVVINTLMSVKIFCEQIPETTYPLAFLLCGTIAWFSYSLEDPKVDTLGALNIKPPHLLDGDHHGLQRFRDFDAYHLVRDSEYYIYFLQWKAQACARAIASLPAVGDILPVHCTAPVPNQLFPWRCYGAYQPVPLPDEVLRSVCSVRRPRDSHASDAVKSLGRVLAFEIVEVKQEGEDSWSQVYVGKLSGPEMESSGLLCLKVFDERCFPVPSLKMFNAYTQEDRPRGLLARLHHADAMLRREEAAYHRLSEYQGTLIPHFYGCHEVELPGGYKAFGILMEYIDGTPLGDFMDEHSIDSWPHDEQVNLYKRVRQVVKMLNASHISQRDWHANQILRVPRRAQGLEEQGPALDHTDEVDLVVVDFAFATQPWCQKHVLPEKRDTFRLAFELGIPEELKKEAGWLPEQREDYEL